MKLLTIYIILALLQSFCQTVNHISTKGLDTKFDVLKMNAHFKNAFGCTPFLPWRTKVEIKRMYEIADHILALPHFFCQTS